MKFIISSTESGYNSNKLLFHYPWMETYDWLKTEKINYLGDDIEICVIEGESEKIFNAMKDMSTDFKKELAIDFNVNIFIGLPTIEIIDDYR